MIAVAILVTLLTVTGTPYKTYFRRRAVPVHFLLGPATVALAVPLYMQLPKLRRHVLPLLGGLLAGSSWWLWYPPWASPGCWARRPRRCASLAPKSVTIPIAMGVAEKIGGLLSLTAVLVMGIGHHWRGQRHQAAQPVAHFRLHRARLRHRR
ncbi:LrgB family protein [Cupriavidus basilensis]